MHPGDLLSRRQRLVYVLVLGALTALGPFTIDLYLPAFPAIETELDVQTALIQLTLTATTVGFALGQLVVGPLSDKVGRRLPLILATAVHVGASLGAAMAPDITWLFVFRVLQGVGAAGGGVVALAIVRDLFGGYPLVRMLSRLALVNGLAPILAPVIGSQLLLVTDWRGIFGFLVAYGVVIVVLATLFIRETLPRERRALAGHSTVWQRYRSLFSDRVFVGSAIVGGMTFSALFSYLSSSSFLFQNVYGLDPQQYGLLFGINSLGIVAGVQISSRLARRVGPQWIIAGATIAQLVAVLTILGLDLAGTGFLGIVIPLWFFILSCGFIFPCVQVLALAHHGQEAGTAASVLGAMNFGLAGLISPIVGIFSIVNAVPMAIVMACAISISIVALWAIIRPRTVPPIGS